MARNFFSGRKVKKDLFDLNYSPKDTSPSFINIQNKGKVYQKIAQKFKRDHSNKRDTSFDVCYKNTENNLYQENKKSVFFNAKEDLSMFDPNQNLEHFNNPDKKFRQRSLNNLTKNKNVLRPHNQKKNFLKNSFIFDSKLTSPFSSNTSMNEMNNVSPYLITKNNNPKVPIQLNNLKNINHISKDSSNILGFIEDKKEEPRSTSFDVKNSRNPVKIVESHERKNSCDIKIINNYQKDRLNSNLAKVNLSLVKQKDVKESRKNLGNIISPSKPIQSKIFDNNIQRIVKPIICKKEVVILKENGNFLDKKQSKKNVLLSRNNSKDISETGENKRKIGSNLKDLKSNRVRSTSNDNQIDSSKIKFIKENEKSLTNYHLVELKNITEVYFFRESKKIEEENKFDDEKGRYIITIGDHIYYRYEIVKELGRGSFGQAIKCYDHKRKRYVCVKIIKNKTKIYNQSKKEISILEYISKENKDSSACVIEILSNFQFREHMCIVFELLEISLYDLLKSNNFNGLTLDSLKKISYQILETLEFLRQHRLIHCDLKPENILLKYKDRTAVKIIDFGSSCFEDKKIYNYIQSRYYRAPEVILGCDYGIEIDLWSFGCIVVELYSGYPIFSGEDERDQLNYIMEYLGIPPANLLEKSRRKSKFFNENNEPIFYKTSRGKTRRPNTKKLEKFLGIKDEKLINFIESFLVWEPHRRLVPSAALQHCFLQDVCKLKNFK